MNKSFLPLSVGIIGCGWLGTALAKDLLKKECDQKCSILATSQSLENTRVLQQLGFHATKLTLPATADELNKHAIFKQKSFVICIPPKLKQGQSDYPEKIQQLVRAAEFNQVKRLIMVSTTAVYNGLIGEVDEQSALDFCAEKVSVIDQAEQVLLSFKGNAAIIRLGGLIGPERHPGRFLSRGRKIADGNAWVNLIHQTDAVGLLKCLLFQQEQVGIFNGVSKTNASKKEFYQAAAKSLDLPMPEFVVDDLATESLSGQSKKIKGTETRQQLAYHFVYDDLLVWLTKYSAH